MDTNELSHHTIAFSLTLCLCATFSITAASTLLIINCASKKKKKKPTHSECDEYTWLYIGDPNVMEQLNDITKSSKASEPSNSGTPIENSQAGSKVSKMSNLSNQLDFQQLMFKSPTAKKNNNDNVCEHERLSKTAKKSIKHDILIKSEKEVKPVLLIKRDKLSDNQSKKRDISSDNENTYCTVKLGNEASAKKICGREKATKNATKLQQPVDKLVQKFIAKKSINVQPKQQQKQVPNIKYLTAKNVDNRNKVVHQAIAKHHNIYENNIHGRMK